MKKFLLLLAGIIALIVAISLIGPITGILFSAVLVAAGMHFYLKSNSVFGKVMWIVVGIIGLLTAISNIPAMIGLAAIAVLYIVYKKWKNEDINVNILEKDDPFNNFEREWAKLTK